MVKVTTSGHSQSAGGETVCSDSFAHLIIGKHIVNDAVLIHIVWFLFVHISWAIPSIIVWRLVCFFADSVLSMLNFAGM